MSSPRPSWAASGTNDSIGKQSQNSNTSTSNTTTTTSMTTSPPRTPMAPKLLAVAASPRWAEHADDEFLTNTKNNSINNIHTTASTADDEEEEDDDFFATDAELVAALDAATAVVMTTSGVSGGVVAGVGVNSGATTPRVDAAAALLVHGDEFSLRFFLPALVKEKSARRAALAQLTHQLMQPNNVELLRSHIRRIVRIHASCPLRDWTAACERVIAHARASQLAVPTLRPISRFFEQDAMLSPFSDREGGQVRALFRAQFLGSGRLSYLDRVLSFRPDYAQVFHTCQVVIMREQGPLPVVWRHYVALIAAARHRSAYLCELETEQFLLSGGDKTWLDGIAACPTKLQSYAALDAIVAHQPWLLTAAHVAPLLRGNDAWTIGEIVHAIVISATFRALAGIVAGCGINNEIDFVNVNGDAGAGTAAAAPAAATVTSSSSSAVASGSDSAAHATELVIKRLQMVELTESGGLNDLNDAAPSSGGGNGGNGGGSGGGGGGGNGGNGDDNGDGGAEIVEQFDRAGQEDDVPRRPSTAAAFPLASVGGTFFAMAASNASAAATTTSATTTATSAASAASPATSSASAVPALLRTVSAASADGGVTSARLQLTEAQERETAYLLKYIGPNTLRHAEFKVHSDSYKVFRVNDWSWPHQGYELLLRFLPRVAQPLDNLFELAQTMTDNCFNTFDNLDTGPYRRAAWQYVQRIKGVLHDDYDYKEINQFLNKFNKEFLKKVVCYPEFITAHDYQQLGYVLAPHEKLHLCALVVESRKQAELLYALHAVMSSTMNPTHHVVTP